MKLNRKVISNIAFFLLIGAMLYPPTKIYFIRFFSFAPSVEQSSTIQLQNYNWSLKGLNTEDLDFNTAKNKVVFVNLWATWCPPCVAELPSIQTLYNDYKDKVEFVFVTNEDWETVSKFYQKRGYDLPTYNRLTQTPKELYSKSIPATYIIDKSGTIVVSEKGAADWNSDKNKRIIR